MQGASPLASPGLDGTRHGHCLWKTGSFGFNGALAPAGAAGTRVVKSPPPVHLYAGSVSAVGGSVQGCRGLRPRQNKLWAPPFPLGRGAGGMGAESKPKAGSARDKQSNPPQGFLYGRSAGVKEVNAAGVKFMPPDVAKKPRMWYTECGKPAPIYAREKEP